MGEYKGTLSQISRNYNLWIVVVSNPYGSTATKVVDQLFKHLARDIGPEAMISEMQGAGVSEAEEKFGITPMDPRPVLVITQAHPAACRLSLKYGWAVTRSFRGEQGIGMRPLVNLSITDV